MGLFTRKDSASQASSRPRPSVSSEAQAAELRGRARRRLAGAVALVLGAIIVLPMVLDSEPVPVAEDVAIRMPEPTTPYQPQVSPSVVADAGSGTVGTAPAPGDTTTSAETTPAAPSDTATQPSATPPVTQPPPEEPPKPEAPKPEAPKPAPAPPKPKPTPKPAQRDDDGARALALLEGRAPTDAPKPAAPKPATKGNFVLQIASYSTQADAQSRRSTLHQAGVTNAFVQPASVGGKQQYRLRVGPFPSREAAQAAQARLRTLGYDNGFIASQ